jgi:F0F1-type ATP synthase assembly protein I
MKFREVAQTIFWRPPPNMQGATSFAVVGSTIGFAAGVYCSQGEQHLWFLIATTLLGDFAGAGVYLVLRSAGLLRSSPPKAPL